MFRIFLLLLLCKSTFSQINYFTYHANIIRAEEMFLNDSIKHSLLVYKNIFDDYKPFAKDAFIALELVCNQKDTTNLYYFFEKAFQAGINYQRIENTPNIKQKLYSNPHFQQQIKALYNQIRPDYIKSLNLELRKYLTHLSQMDDALKKESTKSHNKFHQWLEKQDSSYFNKYDNKLKQHPASIALKQHLDKDTSLSNEEKQQRFNNYIRLIRKKYNPRNKYDTMYVQLLDTNIYRIIRISKKLGYVPGEKTIGIIDNELDHIYKISKQKFSPIIVHQFYHHGCGFQLLQKELLKSIEMGEIHPRLYGLMHDFALNNLHTNHYDFSRNDFYELSSVKCKPPSKDKSYQIKVLDMMAEKGDSTLINKCRKEMSISSLSHDRRKTEYAKKHKLKLFFGLYNEI